MVRLKTRSYSAKTDLFKDAAMGNRPSILASGTWKCGRPNCGHGQGTKISLHFLLIGRTGDGKSATGNFILEKKPFPTSGASCSKTKEVNVAWRQHGCYDIKVVDGPGLKDTALSKTVDVAKAVEHMEEALILCNGGVHAFLLVLKLGQRFTLEMKETISDLKAIFGDNYLNERGIIVVTGGDDFEAMMKNDCSPGLTFEKWIMNQEQNEDLKKLVGKCEPRILLFDNFTTDKKVSEAQRRKLFDIAEELGKKGTYTSTHFRMYRDIRKKLEERNGPLFKEDLQKNVHLFIDEIAGLIESPTLEDIDCFDAAIKDLLLDVGVTIGVESTLQKIKLHLTTMETHIDKLKLAIDGKHAFKVQSYVHAIKVEVVGLKNAATIRWDDCSPAAK